MGVLTPGSAHTRPFAWPPIDSGHFTLHVSAESPSNISPNPSEVISKVFKFKKKKLKTNKKCPPGGQGGSPNILGDHGGSSAGGMGDHGGSSAGGMGDHRGSSAGGMSDHVLEEFVTKEAAVVEKWTATEAAALE
jgi:hypothetical protein